MCPAPLSITDLFDPAADVLAEVSDHLYGQLLAWLLIAVGIWFTVRTRGLQFRLFGQMLRAIAGSRAGGEGISSFQAFTIGLASRVGTGNIVGVALAIILGGPGAVFWMWVVALVGMATGFIESTLAQMYKIRHPEGTFRGGPAYYISRGLGSRRWAGVFAVVITFVFGFAYEATQANAISKVMEGTFGVPAWGTAVALMVLATPVVVGGISIVARIAEWMAPLMAGLYALMAIVVLVLHAGAIPGALASIVSGAFGADQAVAGISGGFAAAALNGIKRGLFSNEAGEGSVPNAAATATVAHPVQQGLIQSLGVFVDTIVVCTATAFIILVSGVYSPALVKAGTLTPDAAATLTSDAVAATLGSWTAIPMAIVIFVLAFSSIIAAATYSEVSMTFISERPEWRWLPRLVSVVSTGLGALASLTVVWNTVDITMAVMTLTNLVALIWLARWGVGALRDWDAQRAAGRVAPLFSGVGNPYLPGDLPGDVWTGERTHLAEAGGTADDGVPAATPASSQPAASTGADA